MRRIIELTAVGGAKLNTDQKGADDDRRMREFEVGGQNLERRLILDTTTILSNFWMN